jgi:para-aminobenzoate synthetase/4-amino-4-deoxychorismate lyase
VVSAPAGSRICEPLGWDLSAADALRLVRDDAHPAALMGAWAGGCDLVCSEPAAICREPELPWHALDATGPHAAGPGAAGLAATESGPGRPAFGGGWIGYLGFGLAGRVRPAPPAPGGPRRLPSWWLGYYDHVLRRDRASGQWFFEALWTPDRASALDARLAALRGRAASMRLTPRHYDCGDFRLLPPPAGHRSAVRRAIEAIRQGDIFQANICLRLEGGFDGDPLDAFCAAVTDLDPPYAAFLRPSPDSAVASLSPELFLRRDDSTVWSRPIKGTMARPAGPIEAAAQLASLERSAKNRAENIMIVDLMRSDLSRVCVPGTVRVPELLAAEPHPGVWHLVSEVRGELTPGTSDSDLVRATFPPGSVTGAPKVRAIEIIHELEASPREVYTGAIGYCSPLAGLELNVAIRTFEFQADRVWLGAGGGIVTASRPADEYRECLLKAAPLVSALGGRISGKPASRPPGRTGLARPNQPDPALLPLPATGIFTSLLVRDGIAERIGDHLDRLDSSARALFGKGLPAGTHDDLARCLSGRPSGRLRITVRPLGGPLHTTIELVPVQNPPASADLIPVVIPGGIGGHKWADRRLLGHYARAARTGPAGQLLIEDAGGQVLETDRANLFAVTGGVIRTPPADGRLLPGVTRAAVLKLASAAGLAAELVPLTRRDLTTASEVFVTNSVRGVLPVRSVAGTELRAAPGPVTARLAAALAAEAAHVSAPCVPDRSRALASCPPGSTVLAGRPATAPTVVVIDNYDSFTYNLVHYLAAAGCSVEVVRNDEVTASQVAAYGPAGVVISPGPGTPADAGISIDVVRACAPAIPVLGVCLGHQAIAASYGAVIIAAPRPVHGQTSVITHDGRGVLAGLPQRFRATRYHSLIIDEQTLPSFLQVTARTSSGIPMGLRHAVLPVEGVQFHPESIRTEHGQAIIASYARRCQAAASDGQIN